MQGTVKWFNDARGFGFIAAEDGQDLFVHYKSIATVGFKTLSQGQRVTFEVEQTRRGPQAINVEPVSR